MSDPLQVTLPDLQATRRFADQLAASCAPPLTIALAGSLGAGKTQLVRYLCNSWGVPEGEVTSPTYVLLQRYRSRFPIYHFDFYRLENVDQVWELGIDELFEQPIMVLIEWADKFPECLPDDHVWLQIDHRSDDSRTVELTAHGVTAKRMLDAWRASLPQESKDLG